VRPAKETISSTVVRFDGFDALQETGTRKARKGRRKEYSRRLRPSSQNEVPDT